MIWVHEGKLIEVNQDALREIIAENVVTARRVNRGSAEQPNWTLVYSPYEPTQNNLRTLLTATERPLTVQRVRGASLFGRVPKT